MSHCKKKKKALKMLNLVYFHYLVLGWNDPFYEIHLAITNTFVNELNQWIKAGVRLWIQSTCMGSKLGLVIKHFLCKQRQRLKKTAFNSVKALPKITTCPRRDCVLSQRKQVRRKWSEMEEDFTVVCGVCLCVCFFIYRWGLKPEYTQPHGDLCHGGDLNWGPHG